jgi:PAS domain S-box-containing protein
MGGHSLKKQRSQRTKSQISEENDSLRRRVRELESGKHPDRLSEVAQRVYDEAPIGLCYLDTDLRYRHINDWLAALNGLSVEDHLGRSVGEVLPHVAASIEPQLRRVIQTGDPILGGMVDAETAAQPGVMRSFQHNYLPVRSGDGAVVGVSCIVEDVTERKQAEEALRQGEERFRAFAESTSDRFWEMDEGLRFTFHSGAPRAKSGFKRDETIGKTPWEIYGIDPDRDDHWRHHKEDLENHRPFRDFRHSFVDEGGQTYNWSVSGTPIFGEDGDFRGYSGTARNIGERVEAEEALRESERRLARIMETMVDGVITIDERGVVQSFNAAAETMFGYTAAEVVGKNVNMLMPKSQARRHDEYIDNYLGGGEPKIIGIGRDVEGLRKDGSVFPMHLGVSQPDTGEKIIFTGIIRDITELKRTEAALREAKDEAETANHAKSDFLSSMSHELRTPMNAILGFGQMLEFNPKDPLTASQKECVGYILEGGQHLLELINDVLDLAKIEDGNVDLSIEDVGAGEVLDECLLLIQAMADERGIDIVVGDGFETAANIRADQTRFKQSLLNLMSNAVKYNREGGKVTIDCHETPGAMLRVSVTATGPGIPNDMQGELFEPFRRLGAETTKIEGTGIGLTITKRIIERMGGHIGVDTKLGTGSTFWIELPLAERKLIDEAVADRESVDDGAELLPDVTGTVLYVEDNPANLDLMKVIVARIEGLSMISAHNGELAIEMAKSKTPDLIILDINLPGMDGFEALRKLQSLEETKDVPVIALSAIAMLKDIEKGIAAGFRQYLTKPINVEEIVNTIKDVLED